MATDAQDIVRYTDHALLVGLGLFGHQIGLFDALDKCWEILAQCFEPEETGIRDAIVSKHWPKKTLKKEPEKTAEPVEVS